MRTKKGKYLLLVFLLTCSAGMAQLTVPFSMVPIASSAGGTVITAGIPIMVSGSGKCLNVNSGLSTLNISNNAKGTFGASCVETAPAASVVSLSTLNLFPNPTHSIAVLKCEGQFDANLFCRVGIVSMDGKQMMLKMVSMKELVAGYQIDAAGYPAGNYVVTIGFMNQQSSLKLIKL